MSLGKRNSEVGGMLSVPRSRAPAPVINIFQNGDDNKKNDAKASPGGGTAIPKAGKPGVGGSTYDPKAPVPQISDKDNYPQALDKLTTGMGKLRDQNGPIKSNLGALAKGHGAGRGRQKKANESAIADLLNFGKTRGKKSGTNKILSGAK